ncbi:putative metabolite transport protein YwtG [Colletotrichum tanaceti]|uniref:Putative metabolite transport protein YwtG n=1 Tax=Colletotrichum tanaceti TaxID=1306861 RepID=A0A4U6XU00_9PEZI|nr:putative metabolite transport protein YwtG [Colletotrichum tanaceti]TKW59402.1 putative metabolite transport protein YwtG [Colletotrichum tanaceti]
MVANPKLEKVGDRSSADRAATEVSHIDHPVRFSEATAIDEQERKRLEASRKLENPLAGLTPEQLGQKAEDYCREHGIDGEEDIRAFRLGAMIAGNMNKYDTVTELTAQERAALDGETAHKWRNPKMLYGVVAVCSFCAVVQGMDETVVNGAQSFYKSQFGIGGKTERDTWLLGLTNSAPYLCCAVVGCWLTEPMNKAFGRRGTVFISCLISALACFWQAFTNTWWHMFIARFMLGFGIGPKSATTPIFAAECAPPRLRGALVMQWQMWTAFGIMMGYVADLAFYYVPDRAGIVGLNWRLMMGSAMIPAVFVCACCYMCPESPRWYLTQDRHSDAFNAMCQLRFEKVQAARDLFYASALLQAEKESQGIGKQNRLKEFFAVRRNRNAMIASEVVMFMQQFCGVNVIAYYSSEIFLSAEFSEVSALSASLGFGVINWLFALPAFYTIDTFGRRNLLLTTFPLMAVCLFFTGFSFYIPTNPAKIACIATGIYLFGMVYSPGEGPVPFTYSAEAYPLYIRPIGMSLATATTWFFNFILAVTWPSLQEAFTPTGAFGWYAGWNIVGFFLVLFLLPETKEKTLEELDAVFSVPLRRFARYGLAQFVFFCKRYVFRRDVSPPAVPVAGDVAYHREQFEQEKEHNPTARV